MLRGGIAAPYSTYWFGLVGTVGSTDRNDRVGMSIVSQSFGEVRRIGSIVSVLQASQDSWVGLGRFDQVGLVGCSYWSG